MIERLRALEKKFREDGRRAANGPMCDGASEYAVAGTYIACADELAALIAELGQEVGAEVFAWVREQPRGWGILTELDVSKPADPAEMLANGWFPVYRTSPAHTSEAGASHDEAVKFHMAAAIELQLKLDNKTAECEAAQDALKEALSELSRYTEDEIPYLATPMTEYSEEARLRYEYEKGWNNCRALFLASPAEWITRRVAHTSEARDAARMNWLDTATTAGSVEMTFSHSDVLKLRGMGSVRQCCDAAMRQEGE